MDNQNQKPIPQSPVPQVPPNPPTATPIIVAPSTVQPSAVYTEAQSPTNNQPAAQSTQPLSRSDFEKEANKKDKGRKLLKISLASVVVIVVLGAGGFFAKTLLSDLNTKTLTNGGYTYSFKFYKSAKLVTIQGVQSYSYSGNVTAVVNPTTQPLQTSCSGQETEAFSVTVNGSEQPVCTGNNGTVQVYAMHFRALNSNQYFLLLYPGQQSPPADSTLKTIFGSIKVSQ
jgi:hypothetical protein